MTDIKQYSIIKEQVNAPILANMTEFGKTPLYSIKQLKDVNVDMVLYPLSGFRAMNHAALEVYESILRDGHQKNVLNKMQTRDELYEFLDYHSYEEKLDKLFKKKTKR